MRRFIFIILITSLLAITGCGLKPGAKGSLDEIIVLADSAEYSTCRKALSNAVERIIDTPQPETVFTLEHIPWENFSDFSGRPNVLIIGTLESEEPVSEYIKGMLDDKARQGVENGVYWFFSKKNPWYSKQLLCIVCANDPLELASRIVFGADDLFHTLNESMLSRLHDMMYSTSENRMVSKELNEKYGFRLRVQHDYYIVNENPEERLMRIRRTFPDRWLTISWNPSADSLSEDLIIAERARIGKLFADPARIYPKYNRFQSDESVYPGGIMLRGLWATEANIGGGPFFTYALQDTNTGTIYFLDGAVFAPNREKLPFLQQLEVMARTFEPPAKSEG